MNEALVVCVRGIISFFTLFILTRFLGKQQLGQITFFDYIVGITVGSFGASLTADLSSAAWPHWVGLLTWIVLGFIMQITTLKSKKMSDYINDSPKVVIHNGMIMGENLKSSKFSMNELLSQLRLKDIYDVNEVKFAVIETNGQLSVLKRNQFGNIVNSNDRTDKENLNSEVVFSGLVIDDNLRKFNLSEEWLLNQMKMKGIDSTDQIFYAYLDNKRRLVINLYTDKITKFKDIIK